jgi:long-chain acyl-CoA synthetase
VSDVVAVADVAPLLARAFATLPEALTCHARQRPDHPALVLDEVVLDYAALDQLADRVAAALQRDGLRPGEVVALCAATSISCVVSLLGALRAGLTVAPLAPSLTNDQIAQLAANAGARRLWVDTTTAARALVPPGCPQLPLADAPWTTWLADAHAPQAVATLPEQPFNIIYSSGTTGVPKGIVQSHAMRWAQIRRAPAAGFGPDAVTLLPLPLYSNLTLSYLFSALGTGGTAVLMARFDAADYLALAEQHRATHTVLVPVQFRRLLDHPRFAQTDLSRLTRKLSAGAPFAAELKREVLARWSGELIEYYGMTEGGGRTELRAHQHPDKLHTVGRPTAGDEFRVISEDGHELPAGAVGEIVARSPTMMSGYHGNPEATRAVEWFDAQGQRFIRSGDVGRFDEDGFLLLTDRRKDMLISGGFNVYPGDIEAVLHTHPAVREAAVIGVPSARWGESPVALVVTAPGTTDTETELLAWANTRLAKPQRLAELQFVDHLPRSEVGKVLKRSLRETFTRPIP